MNTRTNHPTERPAHTPRFNRGFRPLFRLPRAAGLIAALTVSALLSSCVSEPSGIVGICIPPTVTRTSPFSSETNVPLNKTGEPSLSKASAVKMITATFSVPMDPSTINASTFIVHQGPDTLVGSVSYSDTTAIFLAPNDLKPGRVYTAVLTTGMRDKAGTPLVADYTWSFTTVASGTPTLVFPLNGALNQANNPALVWNSVPGADTYRLQVSVTPTFIVLIEDDSTITSTFRQVDNLNYGTTYYWRVNATLSGQTGAYSSVWSFTTLAAPAPPVLTAPGAAALNQPTAPTLTWNASPGAATYRLQVSTSPLFIGTLVNDSTITGTSRQLTGLVPGTTYYWRVNAKNVAGTSAYSARSFTTIATAPLPPVLVSPADAATNIPTSPVLSWNASVGADTYRLQVSTSASFATVLFEDSTITGTSRQITGLALGVTYYWRVNAKNTAGTSANSNRSFTTIGTAPLAPTLISPADSATGVSTAPNLSWNASVGADSYRLQVSLSPTFATLFLNDSTLVGTSRVVTGLALGTTYYWRVSAKNEGGTSGFSVVRRFATVSTGPLAPVLIAPTDTANNIATNPTLSWSTSVGADTYRLQVSTTSAFTTTIVNDSTITGTSQGLTGLTPGETYYWRVRAKNIGGTSPYSSIWRFTVAPAIQTVPLGRAARMGAMGGNAGITNQGILTQVFGSLATTAASTLVTGFHDGTIAPSNSFTETPLNIGNVRDTIYTATAPPGSVAGQAATQALADAQTAYNTLVAIPSGSDPGAGELGGLTLAPGTYTSASGSFGITLLDVTLDGQGDPNARFVFQMANALTVGSAGPAGARTVHLINGAQAKNVFWQVGSAATINGAGGGTMEGTIIASSGVSFSTAGVSAITTLNGRALSLVASVTMVNTVINVPLP